MAYIFPDSIITEYHDGSSWIDISEYVVSDIDGSSGFIAPRPDDRMAGLGIVRFDLNNADGYFTPYGGDAVHGFPTLTGFKKGAKIRTRVVVVGRSKTVWTGRIADIKSDDGTWGNQRVHLLCVDYTDVLTRFPMKGSSILTNQTIDQAVTAMLARLSIQPEGTSFDVGNEILPAVFSNVKDKTKAIGELDKLLMSELGYGYILKDGTLRIENNQARKGTRALDQVSKHPNLMDNLLLVDGDGFELADGYTLLLEEPEVAQLTYTAEKLEIETSDDQTVNAAYVAAYPVRVDTSLQVVFSLGQPIAIAPGASVTLSGRYTNPNGGNPINATNLQAPVITTDYLFNAAYDGSGTNLSANLTVTPMYYGDLVDYVLTNTGGFPGWVTKLQARGYGIYFDSSIEGYVSDEDAIDANGDHSIILDQTYKRDVYAGIAYAKSAIELMKDPKSRVMKVSFNANLNEHHMMACTDLDIGSLISLYENRSEMNKWYYIFSRAFTITLGGVLLFTFGCVEAPSIDSGGLNPVAVEFHPASTDAVIYGHLPNVYSDNTPETISFSIWFRLNDLTDPNTTNAQDLIQFNIDPGGMGLYMRGVSTTPELYVYSNVFSSSTGQWKAGFTPTAGAWHHVVMTFDISSPTNDPIVYYDGVLKTVTEAVTPSGSKYTKTGVPLIIGNRKAFFNYATPLNGRAFDARVYHKILTQAEVTAIYNSGTPSMSAGAQDMVFQAPAINSDLGDAASLNGQQIPTGNNYFDNILRHVGTPHGAPIIRQP